MKLEEYEQVRTNAQPRIRTWSTYKNKQKRDHSQRRHCIIKHTRMTLSSVVHPPPEENPLPPTIEKERPSLFLANRVDAIGGDARNQRISRRDLEHHTVMPPAATWYQTY